MQTTKLMQFRYQLYQHINKRADATLDLLDALSSQTHARSVVELSLNPYFRRQYSSVYKAIAEAGLTNQDLARLAKPHLGKQQRWPFYRLCVDVTPLSRPFASCLADRGFVYSGTGRKVFLGHQYSTVVSLPEMSNQEKTWVTPLAVTRVETTKDKELVGAEQIAELLTDEMLPFGQALTVLVGDTYYSKPAFLCALLEHKNLVILTRARADRVFYRQPNPKREGPGRGKWYGERFVLGDPTTWPEPDASWSTEYVSLRGHQRLVRGSSWSNILMRGKRKPWVMPLQRYPFTLIRIMVTNADGTPAFRRPLWLIVIGQRRHELSLSQAYETFQRRFRHEHAFRFKKQRLLLTEFQTTDQQMEESWWRFVHLAYLQLWVAKPLVDRLPRPWERYLPQAKARARPPTVVQRDLGRILRQVGTPAKPVKPRGFSPGRPLGFQLKPRKRHPTVRKRPKPA
jgi:hypothetical protein